MRAGKMDRRIVIERYIETQDASGQPVRSYEPQEPVATVWAEYVPARGGEALAANQAQVASLGGVFRIRWMAGLDETMQVIHEGEVWGIDAIAEIGRREGLELQVTKKTAPVGNEAA